MAINEHENISVHIADCGNKYHYDCGKINNFIVHCKLYDMNDIRCNELSKSHIGSMVLYEHSGSSFSYNEDSDYDDIKDKGSVMNNEEVKSSMPLITEPKNNE